ARGEQRPLRRSVHVTAARMTRLRRPLGAKRPPVRAAGNRRSGSPRVPKPGHRWADEYADGRTGAPPRFWPSLDITTGPRRVTGSESRTPPGQWIKGTLMTPTSVRALPQRRRTHRMGALGHLPAA